MGTQLPAAKAGSVERLNAAAVLHELPLVMVVMVASATARLKVMESPLLSATAVAPPAGEVAATVTGALVVKGVAVVKICWRSTLSASRTGGATRTKYPVPASRLMLVVMNTVPPPLVVAAAPAGH